MSDDDIDDDDLDSVDDEDSADDLPEVDSDGGSDDDGDEPATKTRKKAAAEDPLEGLSVEAKAREREMLARQMEEFMARGGKIQEVDANVVGDPPKRPDSKYGSRPI